MTFCHRCDADDSIQRFHPNPDDDVTRQRKEWIDEWIEHTRNHPHLPGVPSFEGINVRQRLVEITYKNSPQDLYSLDQNFKVTSVESLIGLNIGDTIVEFMKVNLRGQAYKVYENRKKRLQDDQFVTLVVLRKDCDQQLLQQHVKVRKDVLLDRERVAPQS